MPNGASFARAKCLFRSSITASRLTSRSNDEAAHRLATHHFQIDWSVNTILRLIEEYDFQTVLDIGSGAGEHTRFFRHYGKQVFSVDLDEGADYVGDFNQLVLDRQFDVVWCS